MNEILLGQASQKVPQKIVKRHRPLSSLSSHFKAPEEGQNNLFWKGGGETITRIENAGIKLSGNRKDLCVWSALVKHR